MRFVVAKRLTARGAGLGNEMLPWSKGWIASQVLDARLVGPAWGINPRKYYRNFQTSRWDVLLEEILKRLPHYAFTERDYLETCEIDFGKAIEKWAQQIGILSRRSFIVTVDGMYGGYSCIRNARSFLLSRLLSSRDALRNLYEINARLDRNKLFVAVHMRAGDFAVLSPGESAQGKWNIRIPDEWYLNACQAIQSEWRDNVQFHFFTDRGGPAFEEAVRRFNPGQIRQGNLTECSDLLLMSQADLCLCSISSYSYIAVFLSGALYLCYEPQLQHENGLYKLFDTDEVKQQENAPSRQSMDMMKAIAPGSPWEAAFKGYAMGTETVLPSGMVKQLNHRLLANDRSASLVEGGGVPDWTLGSGPS